MRDPDRRRWAIWAVGATVLALALAAAPACRSAPPRDTLTVLITSDPTSLDPNREIDLVTDSVLFNAFEPLVGFDSDLHARPILAESWEHPTPERWRFRLRKGVRFHDGSPFDAEAVRASLMALKAQPDLEASQFLTVIRAIEVVDADTVDLVTHEPRSILSTLPFVYVTKPNGTGQFPPLVGTGPYRVTEWTPQQRVVLERWDRHWAPPPPVRRAVFVPVPDPEARLARLQAKEADISYGIPPRHAVAAPPTSAPGAEPSVRFVRRAGLTVFYLVFNLRPRPPNPFLDIRVRQALHLAIDRAAIVRDVLHGAGNVATQPVAPLVFGFDPALPPPAVDRERAKVLLAEAGHGRGLATRLDFPSGRLAVAQRLQSQLAAVGVTLELNPLSPDHAYELASGAPLFLAGWGCSTGEASEFFEFCLHTPTSGRGAGNYGAYSNPELDQIAETNGAVLDARARRSMLQRAARIVMKDLPILPLYVEDDVYGVAPGVRFAARADSEIRLTDVSFDPR